MSSITTEAWVLYEGPLKSGPGEPQPGELRREEFSFPDITESEILAEPIYGCWEANMTHALERQPIDICRDRKEQKVVLGNAGVVRVLKVGSGVKSVKPGELCLVFCNGKWDTKGFPEKILAYDARNTMGVLAKRVKLHERQVIAIPQDTKYSLQQWAAFSLRYITAWANWKQAYGSWRLHLEEGVDERAYVFGWGGGVTLAELTLATLFGCQATMISSDNRRLERIRKLGIDPMDRQQFPDLNLDEKRYNSDSDFKKAYQSSEEIFLSLVREKTQGRGVSIFVDFIGEPVFRATLKALCRNGVITTAGWKMGMRTSTVRAVECMNWHIHVHTHYARYNEGVAAVQFAEANGWVPPLDGEEYSWDNIPQLARDYLNAKTVSYFPIFQVNQI